MKSPTHALTQSEKNAGQECQEIIPEGGDAPPGSLEQITRGEIDMQISTAKRWPRSISAVKQAMMSVACLDEETAEGCFYTLPRGGKRIQGPSIRMAEIAASAYGNLRMAVRIVGMDTSRSVVTVQAMAIDLERNYAITVESERKIQKKRGAARPDADMINLATGAASSVAFRNAVFRIVPVALVKPVYEQAKLVAVGNASTLTQRREKILARLKNMGALEANILSAAGKRKAEDLGQPELELLIGMGTAIKEGQISVDEAFPAAAKEPDKPSLLASVPEPPQPEQSNMPEADLTPDD